MEGKGAPKSMGCDKANGKIIVTIDSDNSLVEKDRINNMIFPLMNNSEVNYSIYRMAIVKNNPLINQYLSLVGIYPPVIYASLDPQIPLENVELIDKGRYYIYKNKVKDFLIWGFLLQDGIPYIFS